MQLKRGFTLVEISIVLVIIGLLVGGIVVARSIVTSSKLNATVSQIQQFDSAVFAYKNQYDFLPGDLPASGGDGDGYITMGPSCYDYHTNSYAGEIANFWNGINSKEYAVLSSYACPGVPPRTTGTSKNVPLAKMGNEGSFFIASAIVPLGLYTISVNIASDPRENYYVMVDKAAIPTGITNCCYQISPPVSSAFPLKPSELAGLDAKIDDGVANAGFVLSGNMDKANGNPGYASPSTNPASGCSTTTTYNVTNDAYACTPLIRMGSSGNNPQ